MLKKVLFYDLFKIRRYYCCTLWTTSGLLGISVEKNKDYAQFKLLAAYNTPSYELIHRNSCYRNIIHGYFNGSPINKHIKLNYSQYTNWQISVYKNVRNIPYGHILSYNDIALSLKCPNSSRAVGSALKRNKHLLIIPCHRVICNNGTIGGFSSGVKLKTYLLNLEKAYSCH